MRPVATALVCLGVAVAAAVNVVCYRNNNIISQFFFPGANR